MPLRVCGPRVLIQPDTVCQAPEQTAAGLYLATTLAAAVEGEDAAESYYTGTVLALGEVSPPVDVRAFVLRALDRLANGHTIVPASAVHDLVAQIHQLPRRVALGFAIGDRVCFSASAGREVQVGDTLHLILDAAEILAVLDPEPAGGQ